jgi:lipocalin
MKTKGTIAGIIAGIVTTGAISTIYKKWQRDRRIDRSTVRDFEIEDFAGTWYEIARFDNKSESGLTHVVSTVSVDDDGRAFLQQEGLRNGTSLRRTIPSEMITSDAAVPARMRIVGFPFSSDDFNVMELDADYNFALIGNRSSSRLWIWSRMPYIPEDDLRYLLARAMERGYDISRLVFPDQRAVLTTQEVLAFSM